jgi:nitroreductase
MDIMEIIKTRRSIREYSNRPISKEVLEKIVDAGRFAATARDIQPWEFVVITNFDTLNKIGQLASNGKFITQAKAGIAVFCADTKYYLEDGCAATENILLAATSLGVGSCWVAGDKKPYCLEVNKLLNVPVSFKLISLISLGYPPSPDFFKITSKRDLRKVIHWEKF